MGPLCGFSIVAYLVSPPYMDRQTDKQNIEQPVKINGYTLKNVTRFTYLSSVFTYDECSRDLWTRSGKATKVTKSMENIWKSKNITNDTKNRILETTAFNTVLYGCDEPGHTTKRSETNCWHLRCTVTKGSTSVGQSENKP